MVQEYKIQSAREGTTRLREIIILHHDIICVFYMFYAYHLFCISKLFFHQQSLKVFLYSLILHVESEQQHQTYACLR